MSGFFFVKYKLFQSHNGFSFPQNISGRTSPFHLSLSSLSFCPTPLHTKKYRELTITIMEFPVTQISWFIDGMIFIRKFLYVYLFLIGVLYCLFKLFKVKSLVSDD